MKKNTINTLIEAFEVIVTALKEEANESASVKAEPKTTKTAKTSEPDEDEEVADIPTKEELDKMSYNDLKAYAKSIGVKAVGNRNKITQLILDIVEGGGLPDDISEVEPTDDVPEDYEEEETPKTTKKSAKAAKSKPAPVEEEVDEDDEEEDEFADIREQLAEMEVEELADILKDAGLSARGKKEALINKIIKGIEDGDIELEEEPDEEEDLADEDDDTDDSAEEMSFNDLDNEDMTDERREAIVALTKEIKSNVKRKKLTEKEMSDELVKRCGYTKKEVKDLGDDLVDTYIDCMCMFIDDEGEEVEEETPYTINGIPACCGKPLMLNEEDNTYVCSECGNEYEADEE